MTTKYKILGTGTDPLNAFFLLLLVPVPVIGIITRAKRAHNLSIICILPVTEKTTSLESYSFIILGMQTIILRNKETHELNYALVIPLQS
jgi:hypothetical protein